MSQRAVTDALANIPLASLSQRGVVRLSDSRTSLSSSTAATSLTVAHNYTDMQGIFGVIGNPGGEFGYVYTSRQSFATFVHIDGISSTGSNFFSAVVNGVSFRGSMCTNLANQRISISFIVPAWGTYMVAHHSGIISDVNWVVVDKR